MQLRCTRCKRLKPQEDFAGPFKSKNGRRDCYCRPCRSAYHRSHYLENRQRYIDLARRRTDRELEKRMAFLFEYFSTHPCVDCGETDPVVLEFDHLGDKRFDVAAGVRNNTWVAVLSEIEKCEVVCANCHRRRTAMRGGFRRSRWINPSPQGRLFP